MRIQDHLNLTHHFFRVCWYHWSQGDILTKMKDTLWLLLTLVHLHLIFQEIVNCRGRKGLDHARFLRLWLQIHLGHFLETVDQAASKPLHFLYFAIPQLPNTKLPLEFSHLLLIISLFQEDFDSWTIHPDTSFAIETKWFFVRAATRTYCPSA